MQIQADYRNSYINRYKNRNITNLPKNNVSFEGLNLKKLFPSSTSSSVISEKALKDYTYQLTSYLGISASELAPKVEGLSSNGRNFLRVLSRRYSDSNFLLGGNIKEDPQLVFNILDKVKHPKDYHFSVASNVSGDFGFISKIFSAAQDKKSMEFALDFQHEILKNNPSCKNMLIEMLNSPFKAQYMKNLDDYKSYMILNKENPEAIKELDLLMQKQQYDRSTYDIRLAIKRVIGGKQNRFGASVSEENLEKYYSQSGIKFLDKFINSYYARRQNSLLPESEKNILEIYKSTTKDNVQSRIDLLNKFKYAKTDDINYTDSEISYMKSLFELMDSDKHAMSFANKVSTTTEVKFDSIQQLYDVIKQLTPLKADLFSDNIFRIVRRVEDDKLIPALKEHYNNPFFETKESKYYMEQMIRYRYRQPESSFSKLKRTVLNKINEFKLAREEKRAAKSASIKPEQPIVEKPIIIEEKQPVKEIKSPVIKEKPIKKQEIINEKPIVKEEVSEEKSTIKPEVSEKVEHALPFEWNTQKALPSQPQRLGLPAPKVQPEIKLPPIDDLFKTQKQGDLPIKLEHIITPQENETPIKLVNTVKESPKARKLRLIGEVNEFIAKKLSAKTVEKQGEIYGKNVTKMRLKMLPEIFDSIKETRQADRAVGKLKSISANKDAVNLYRLINGSNRKYVKYLLEKRNVDGTRMFEVKDIIAMVEKANKRIDSMKKANPDFKAKDAKAYFDHLYDAKIEQYGKVKKSRNKVTIGR